MADYQLYLLDEIGHISHQIDFEADDDQDALDYVRQHHGTSDIDLRCGTRRIAWIQQPRR